MWLRGVNLDGRVRFSQLEAFVASFVHAGTVLFAGRSETSAASTRHPIVLRSNGGMTLALCSGPFDPDVLMQCGGLSGRPHMVF
jgi:hypothetical protein